ncbi:PREDICTED: probable WRKY transcription factor 54 [Tarenaya hassleriana]|uniref:probable WRKY transcription factor 54 n=1 Tax=Tarenaya hassleriana TaxID=28532 RepID=UPI00053C0F9D|nr:PREDICTED: probable WRKY transcription factor 54 [Tarenaya hassleriana]
MDIKAVKGKVVEQLVQGYEFATQLQLLLSEPFGDHDPHGTTRILSGSGSSPGHVDELVAKILGSFDETISVLGSFEPVSAAVPVDGSRNASSGESPALEAAVYDGRCEDSGHGRKRLLGVNKGKRGCYKRKRKSQSWTLESNTLEDTHAWRKYGQKEILNAKYPRNYFRCTHKYTQGCGAIKQVQKLEHDPLTFQITYIGNHTCNHNEEILTKLEPSEIIVDSDIEQISQVKQDESSSVSAKEDEMKNADEYTTCPTGDLSLVWQEFMAFDEPEIPYCFGETCDSRGVDKDTDLMMVFGSRGFAFGENEQPSFSDAYCV